MAAHHSRPGPCKRPREYRAETRAVAWMLIGGHAARRGGCMFTIGDEGCDWIDEVIEACHSGGFGPVSRGPWPLLQLTMHAPSPQPALTRRSSSQPNTPQNRWSLEGKRILRLGGSLGYSHWSKNNRQPSTRRKSHGSGEVEAPLIAPWRLPLDRLTNWRTRSVH